MKAIEPEFLQKSLCQSYETTFTCDFTATLNHLKVLNYTTVYNMLLAYVNDGKIEKSPKSGRPVTICTDEIKDDIKLELSKDPNMSSRDLMRKFKISYGSVVNIKKGLGFKVNRCRDAPFYPKNQKKRAKTNV